jgi:hypothetical protein
MVGYLYEELCTSLRKLDIPGIRNSADSFFRGWSVKSNTWYLHINTDIRILFSSNLSHSLTHNQLAVSTVNVNDGLIKLKVYINKAKNNYD